jgi:uncharacterized protein involved in exopolysaccharide biosynthesis
MSEFSTVSESSSLAGALASIKKKLQLVVVTVFVGTLIGTSYAFFASPEYISSATLIVREGDQSSTGAQALLGQLGGLAALGGITLGESNLSTEYLTWLRSRQFAERFIQRHQLATRFFQSHWDAERSSWRTDLDSMDVPSAEDAWRFFDRRVRTVTQDKRTGLVTLQTRWSDPREGAQWVALMIEQANDELRARVIAEADRSLEQLEKELARTEAIELQQAIYRLMEVQIKRKVLANSRPDFAFSVIDPPVAPDMDRYSYPNRPLIIAASFFFSLLIGLTTALVLSSVSSTRGTTSDT